MDDSCAVCAESLEWVAYGSCGHRDVCSTCVARLRFICNDRRCCICKTESPVVFVTKGLGEYTVTISDFTVLPSEVKEGRVGKYWYHEDTEAYFDDVDHYKMVKAMCRLSCSVCDGENNEGRRKERFRNIEQLKGHLFHRHKLFMCSLCLEGRKVFICEQKLYTRQQLNQHIRTGDSEVDGNESERGGFMGHPMCEFCRTPFYGDNELYSHMSTEHYTCHICQRQYPGQYEYYKNYDDLEIHFRRDHFLCEDEACLAKKFVVFQTEAEIKRHNTIEHGGRMSRSKRSAALQIPTSFRYRRSSEQDRRGRGRTFLRDQSDDQLSIAIQASLESAHSEGTSHDPMPSSSERTVLDHGDFDDVDSLVHPFEALTSTDPEASSRYLQALGQSSRNSPLVESSFPPLQIGSSSSQQRANHESEGLPNNTMAARLRHQSNRKATAHNSAQAWPTASHGQVPSSSTQNWPTLNITAVSSRSSTSGPTPQNWPTLNTTAATSRTAVSGSALPSYTSSTRAMAQPTVTQGHLSSIFTGNLNNIRMSHSASAPNLTENGSLKPTSSDFPPISVIQTRKEPTSSHAIPKIEDVQSANRSLVEKLRSALENEDKYASFKDISAQYRQGSIDTEKYLYHVHQYGLSHLVLELARLCPDPQKQKELIECHNANLRGIVPKQNGMAHDNIPVRAGNSSKKGKGVAAKTGSSKSKHRMADSFISTVRTLQSNFKPEEEELEVLAKDGYRADKGRSNVMVDEQLVELRGRNDSASIDDASQRNGKDGNGGSKQRKKTSKFNRVRLGDGASILDLNNSKLDPEPTPAVERSGDTSEPSVALPVRGVWRKGGQKLFP